MCMLACVQAVKETQSETEPLRREVERLKDQLNTADEEIEVRILLCFVPISPPCYRTVLTSRLFRVM